MGRKRRCWKTSLLQKLKEVLEEERVQVEEWVEEEEEKQEV